MSRKKTPFQRARAEWSSRGRRWAVGYVQSGNALYVSHFPGSRVTRPMTICEAHKALDKMVSPGAVIFELVPFQVNR